MTQAALILVIQERPVRCQSLDGCRNDAAGAVIKAGAVLELCAKCMKRHVKDYGWQAAP